MSSSDMVQETWWCADGYLLAFRVEVWRLAREGMWVPEEESWVWWLADKVLGTWLGSVVCPEMRLTADSAGSELMARALMLYAIVEGVLSRLDAIVEGVLRSRHWPFLYRCKI